MSDFLDQVATLLEERDQTITRLRSRLADLEQAAAHAEARHAADRRATERERARILDDARAEAVDAKRRALSIVAKARSEAHQIVVDAAAEERELSERVDVLRAVVRRTENQMKGLASGALRSLAQAHLMLDDAPVHRPELEVVVDDSLTVDEASSGAGVDLPPEVDLLLTRLQEM